MAERLILHEYAQSGNCYKIRLTAAWLAFLGEDRLSEVQRVQIPVKRAAGEAALKLMDEHLADRPFFVGEGATLADIALYAYTHVAEEGGSFRLADYPNVQAWLARIE